MTHTDGMVGVYSRAGALLEKNVFNDTIKDGKADFILGDCDRCRDHCNGILEWRKEIGLSSEYTVGKWEFIGKEEDGGHWMKTHLEETSG